ncbi:LysR family transcriptional regulator [Microbacterium sp. K41]|uniref:LysR family transcriptional regulator n=1 Tax=Microbacterium sp. K41 TaxID=2305437 RepID=UPI00109D626E|nr:LysR family transcriptional regulator [Microbacterium sp. K41]
MDSNRLVLLRELADRGSVAAVATAWNVSASAVSQQLAALQAGIPVPLTVRSGRRLVLTEAGEALAVAATRVEEAKALAQGAIETFLERPERAVTVSAFHSAGYALFGPLLARVEGHVLVELADADVAHDEFMSLTADYDLVIAHRLAHQPEWPRIRHVVTSLLVEPLDIAMHEHHPLAAQSTIHPRQLAGERWISTHEGFPLAGVLQHIAGLAGEAPRVAHRINEFFLAAQVIRTGAAIAVMPRITAAALATDGMVLRPLKGEPLVRHVDVLARPDSLALPSVRLVRDALRELAETVGAGPG